jgi:putative ABC transport system permease protein
MLRSLLRDFQHAARALARRPGFALVALTTLALGIGANTAVFSVVNGIVLSRLPFREPDRLVTLGGSFISNAELLYLQENARQLSDVAAFSPGWGMALTSDGEPIQLTAAKASVNLLGMLGVSPVLGRGFQSEESTPGRDRVVLLNHGFWRDRFGGDSAVVGRSITLDGSPFTVVGVLPSDFQLYSQSAAQLLIPVTIDPAAWYHKGQHALGVARLAPGATPATALSELRSHLPRIREANGFTADYGNAFTLVLLSDFLVGPVRTMLLVLLGAVGFIVLIASANVGNLLLVRATERHREVAVRLAIGASRMHVIRGIAAESLLLALGGTLLGFALAVAGVGVLRNLLPADMPRISAVHLDARVLFVCAAVGLLVGAVALLPALASTRANPSEALRATRGDASMRSGLRLRGALVSAEIALALVLVVGAGLMVKTLWRLSSVDPGFQAARVLTFRLQPSAPRSSAEIYQYFTRVLNEVTALPGVQSAGGIQQLPMSGYNWWADIDVEGKPRAAGESPTRAGWRIIVGDYLSTMGIPLLSGRAFTTNDNAGTERVMLINEVLARKLFPGEDPIGHRLRAGNATRGQWVRIVGVTRGVRHEALEQAPDPEMYFPMAQLTISFMNIVMRTTQEPLTLAQATRRAVRTLDASVPIADMRALSTVVQESTARQRLVLRLLAAFAGVGLLLAVIGVYGVVAFGVTQRRHEIGIRTALGARRQSIIGMVLRHGLKHALIGLAVGVPAAIALARTMRGVVYDLSTSDPMTYVAVVLILLVAVGIASWIPARRAAAVDPASVLKNN